MFFTVIITTYNRRYLLKKALDSVLAQTCTDYEIIVVDDGSTDNTAEYQYYKEYSQVNFCILSSNQGVSKVRNTAILTSKGQWLAFLDSDDEWLPNKLEQQKIFIQKNQNLQIFQCLEYWHRNNKKVNIPHKYKKIEGYILEQLLKNCLVTISSVCIKKTLFLEIGYFDEKLYCCEDYDLWLRIANKQHYFGLQNEYLVVRNGGHQDQLSHKYQAIDRFRIYALIKILCEPDLPDYTMYLVQKTLLSKINILLTGSKKRTNHSYDSLLQLLLQFIDDKKKEALPIIYDTLRLKS